MRTINHLQDKLDEDYAWRIKEIANCIILVDGADSSHERMLSRAGVALAYAHFEGFIKNAAENYIKFIDSQQKRLCELDWNLSSIGIRKHLNALAISRNDKHNGDLLKAIEKALESCLSLHFPKAIKTESNVSYEVFGHILDVINIDKNAYETKRNFINQELLKKRNEIAHGENKFIKKTQFRNLAEGVLSILQQYKTDLEMAASNKKYLRK